MLSTELDGGGLDGNGLSVHVSTPRRALRRSMLESVTVLSGPAPSKRDAPLPAVIITKGTRKQHWLGGQGQPERGPDTVIPADPVAMCTTRCEVHGAAWPHLALNNNCPSPRTHNFPQPNPRLAANRHAKSQKHAMRLWNCNICPYTISGAWPLSILVRLPLSTRDLFHERLRLLWMFTSKGRSRIIVVGLFYDLNRMRHVIRCQMIELVPAT